ncbi:MAG: hypothetical protein QM650_18015 [Microlunatus sp.]
MSQLILLEEQLRQWVVPNDVRVAIRRAIDIVTGEGAPLVEAMVGDEIALAVRGQPAAVYFSGSRVRIALPPPDAERAYRADSAIGLEKESEGSWVVNCRYGRLDPSRLSSVTSLMVRALRRYAPAPATRQVTPRRRSSTSSTTSRRSRTRDATTPRPTGRRTEEERQRATEAAIPRCPVPGCNLPMVGGSCGFHD